MAVKLKCTVAGLWLCTLCFAALVYWPGLSGAFLFDDIPNLETLGLHGGVKDWESFLAYVTGGFSGPTGRPISLLTFLIDANNWPADPYSFKRTNLFLHLANGTLVFLLILQVLSFLPLNSTRRPRAALWIAGFCAAAWMLHPYLVSTTLYVVQRMAMLSAFFCFAGLIAYLHGRRLTTRAPVSGYLWMSGAVGLGTVLATFSKENGAVLVLLILALEVTVLRASPICPSLDRRWKWIFLYLPALALALYLLRVPFTVGWFSDYGGRDFSPYERILTQFRVLVSYIHGWFVPTPYSDGLYHDTTEVSRGLLTPITTIFSALVLLGVTLVAWFKRSSWPLFSLAVLFFLAAQAIESTFIGLELKFEHRMYLSSVFLLVPLAHAVYTRLEPRANGTLAVLALGICAGFTYLAADLWGDHQELVMVWAEREPQSARAQIEAAQMLYLTGREQASMELLNESAARLPDDFNLRLTQILIQCRVDEAKEQDKQAVLALADTGPYRRTDFKVLSSFMTWVFSPGCRGLSPEFYLAVTERLLTSLEDPSPKSLAYAHLNYFYGLGLLRAGKTEEGLAALERSLESRSSLHMRMNIAANKATVGQLESALSDARAVLEDLRSANLSNRALAEAPRLEDVEHFIRVVKEELDQERSSDDS